MDFPTPNRNVNGISRRRWLAASGVGLVVLHVRPTFATPENLAAAIKRAFGSRRIQSGRVKIEIPQIAENGNVVPVTINVESLMTADDYVKRIHLFSEHNPLPDIVEFELGPHNGKARVSTRVRLTKSQNVLAVATLNDDTLWSTQALVEVTVSGCG
jgi:sulfur-oxidizing protein SoxY